MTAVASEAATSRTSGRTLRGFSELARAARSSDEPAWLQALRHAAAERFATTGLPSSRDEEWRFTSLQSLAAHQFVALGAPALVDFVVEAQPGWPLLVIVDGRVDFSRSRVAVPSGVSFGSIAAEIAVGNPLVEKHLATTVPIEASPFAAANAALFADGAFVHVAAGVHAGAPLQVVYLTTSAASDTIAAPRSLLVVESGASATVVESFVSVGSRDLQYLTNGVTEVVLAESARLEHIRLQREGLSAWHVGFTAVAQQHASHYRSFTLALGGRLSRHNLHARLAAPNIETLLYGLYIGRGEQLLDNHTAIFHEQPHCNSWEVYKGVLGEKSHGVFNGKVFVEPAAQKTDAKQTNRNLLLSDTARVDTKPQLEIFADDVKCTHGATVGKLNEQQRFYLRTRGIAGREAEIMLITAFVSEVLVEVTQPELRAVLDALVRTEMEALIG
jgi:Fe-S cluster assembly protein SufD